jgi:transformation/transcription domain-associated protein
MWPEISPLQLGRIVDVFTRLMHNTCLNISTHMAAIKVLASLVEVLPTKLAAQDAAKHMLLIMETTADRIEVGTVLYADAHARLVGSLEPGLAELHHIEKSRPLQGAVYIIDRPEQVINST